MLKKLFSPIGFIVSLIPLAAWAFSIIEHFTKSEWILLLAAFFIPPFGVIDGIGLFFGWW